jgi:hypothetical protein
MGEVLQRWLPLWKVLCSYIYNRYSHTGVCTRNAVWGMPNKNVIHNLDFFFFIPTGLYIWVRFYLA